MNTNTKSTLNKSNSLIYKADKIKGKQHIFVTIRLNDECKNGHQDFAITGDIYEAGKPKSDRYWLGGGCCHDEILKAFPEFKIFVDLHNCDFSGTPMYPQANMPYHLKNGFNNTKIDNPKFKAEFCDYYRITAEQFETLKTLNSEVGFALMLENLGILSQWDKQAKQSIKMLEKLTGTKFLNDSKRAHYVRPSNDEIKKEVIKVQQGYYSEISKQNREGAKIEAIITKMRQEANNEIDKAETEYNLKVQVLKIGGTKALDNCIVYNHSKEIGFNWKSYDMIESSLVQKIEDSIKLPNDWKITDKKGKM